MDIIVKCKWSESEAISTAIEMSENCHSYITWHKTKKCYFIRNFKPKLYKQILIGTYHNKTII